MLLWVILALMTAAVLIVLLRPLARPPAASMPRPAYDAAVYRDQLAELARDVERGTVSPAEAAGARLEIERRLLGVAELSAPPPPQPARWLLVAVLVAVPASALALYLLLGSPDLPDAPLAARGGETRLLASDGSLDLAKARDALAAKLAAAPDSLEGWELLGRTDGELGRWDDAGADYTKALALSNRSAEVLEGYGNMLVAQARGQVTPAAKAVFTEAVQKQPDTVGARYELGLAQAQQGDLAGALASWQALEKDAPPGAPWLDTLHDAMAEAAREQASGPVEKPPVEVAALMSLPPDQRGTAIRGMVAGLAAKLRQNPDDLAGWTRLGRSYLVLGEPQKAADAYGKAMALAPGDVSLALGRAQAMQQADGGDTVSAATADAYRKVASLQPDQPDALWVLGLAARQAGHPDEARAQWQKLLAKLDPATPQAAQVKQQLASLDAAK